MRLVVDTNLMIHALRSPGPARRFFKLAPFTHVAARVPLTEHNDWNTPGAAASLRMDFSAPDLAPDLELNQIIWETIRGRGSVMPPPRRSGLVRPIAAEDDDR